MQVSVETTSNLERRMTVEVPAEKVNQEVDRRLRDVRKTTRLNGFRKGKIPFSVVKKRFGGQVHQEVLGDMIQSSYIDALRQEELIPAGQPDIEPASTKPGSNLKYIAVFEVYPDVEIKQLKGLKIEKISAEVQDADIDAMVETLRQQQATWETFKGAAKKGDRIHIDFIGSIDGDAFEGGKAEDYAVEIGSGHLLPDLENALVGMSVGDQKSVEVAFPDDYHAEQLKGNTANFAVTAKKIEQQVLPEVNDEFMTAFGIDDGDVDKFRSSVRENMERELEERVSASNRQAVLDALWESNSFELPKALVAQEIQTMRQDAGQRMGITEESRLPAASFYEEAGRRRVGLGLLLNEVIAQQKLEVDQDLVTQKLESLSYSYEQPEEMVAQYRMNREFMEQIEMMVMEEQVVDLVLDNAEVTEKTVEFNQAIGR